MTNEEGLYLKYRFTDRGGNRVYDVMRYNPTGIDLCVLDDSVRIHPDHMAFPEETPEPGEDREPESIFISRWQPIETAPTTPTDCREVNRLMLWVNDGGLNRKGSIAFGCVYEGEGGYRSIVAHGYIGDFDITHWMPLPSPPEAT